MARKMEYKVIALICLTIDNRYMEEAWKRESRMQQKKTNVTKLIPKKNDGWSLCCAAVLVVYGIKRALVTAHITHTHTLYYPQTILQDFRWSPGLISNCMHGALDSLYLISFPLTRLAYRLPWGCTSHPMATISNIHTIFAILFCISWLNGCVSYSWIWPLNALHGLCLFMFMTHCINTGRKSSSNRIHTCHAFTCARALIISCA